jgi:polysaccharide export outer membrane protein
MRQIRMILGFLAVSLLFGCEGPSETLSSAGIGPAPVAPTYIIGPLDSVNVFVWRNPELSAGATVRPDGVVTLPLVEEMVAAGKTPVQLARDIEQALSTYVVDPIVSVSVGGFNGPFDQQVRIVGEATTPQAIPFRSEMTVLDVMIAVGGVTEFAAANRTALVRTEDGTQKTYRVRVDDLLQDGDISANVYVAPGDILIIPESFF